MELQGLITDLLTKNISGYLFEENTNTTPDRKIQFQTNTNYHKYIAAVKTTIENSGTITITTENKEKETAVFKFLHDIAEYIANDLPEGTDEAKRLKYLNFMYTYGTKYYRGLTEYYVEDHLAEQAHIQTMLQNVSATTASSEGGFSRKARVARNKTANRANGISHPLTPR